MCRLFDPSHGCGQAVHDGYWPGARECAEHGWTVEVAGTLYPDVNRLVFLCDWDPVTRRWRRREEDEEPVRQPDAR